MKYTYTIVKKYNQLMGINLENTRKGTSLRREKFLLDWVCIHNKQRKNLRYRGNNG